RGAARRPILDSNCSAMFGDDAIADAESEPGALPDRLGGVEGVENARRVFYAGPAIRKFDEELPAFHSCPHPQVALCAFFQDRVHGVIDEVKKDLLQLVRIGGSLGKIGREIEMHADL